MCRSFQCGAILNCVALVGIFGPIKKLPKGDENAALITAREYQRGELSKEHKSQETISQDT